MRYSDAEWSVPNLLIPLIGLILKPFRIWVNRTGTFVRLAFMDSRLIHTLFSFTLPPQVGAYPMA